VIHALVKQANDAAQRIAAYIIRTPLLRSSAFSDRLGADVWFKLENRQTPGSFKLRGATNRLLTLTDEQRARGCVAASSGNHGAAVACATQRQGVAATIFVPQHTSPLKIEKMMGFGATVEFFGEDGLDTEEHARAYAEQLGLVFLSPYNDAEVVAGQGTCGLEIVADLPDVDVVFVAVGGGGLIGGVGAVLKEHNPSIRVVGCQPAASPVMMRSIEAGRIVDMPSETTLSDGTAGGIEPGAVTFAINQAVVDDWVEVSEEQIADAMRLYMDDEGEVIEGAAGVAIAGLLEHATDVAGKKVAVIICGGNVSDEVLASVR
jgi:threonine dehydratase